MITQLKVSGVSEKTYDEVLINGVSYVQNRPIPDPHFGRSLLQGLLEMYLLRNGFHPTNAYTWGHPELGEGRMLIHCVEWQIGRENRENEA